MTDEHILIALESGQAMCVLLINNTRQSYYSGKNDL